MKKISTIAVAAAVVAMVLGGCSGGGTKAATPDNMHGTWQLVSGKGPDGALEPVKGTPVSLIVASDGTFSGSAGCNSLFGTVLQENGSLKIQPAATMMMCDESLMKVESAYTGALQAVQKGEVSKDSLVLQGEGTELKFKLVSEADSDQSGK